ncbi:MAG: Asp-tRNA(Asn)/Glu-tRNA(Gln) amidotransferase subunit GatA [Kiritimatiellae bacterium]|nr:Asp-tRNA(Asn)/Glu-tRNA(Gln) amidotransferase subunit GatA [Kiritimatiellia bacterium]
MSVLNEKTVEELSVLLESGACTSQEIVRDVLAEKNRIDPVIRAYVELDEEDALAQAVEADAARARGTAGPLTGIPVAIKDLLNVRGQSCTCGSKILQGYRSPYDATAVARLRSAGMVMAGRVNMDEFAMGSSTENSALQTTRNPWNTACVPGGSSGGSASAVAARMAVASIGSDTGGSVRQPASFCGCVGLKPTYGRISRYGLTAYASSLDQIGPITRTVKDAALLLGAMAGHDPMDSTSSPLDVPDYAASLTGEMKGLKLGVPKEYFVEGIEPEVDACVRKAIAQCESLGAEIVEVSLPNTRYATATYYILATAEASTNLARYDGVRYGLRVEGADPIALYMNTRAAGFGSEVKRRIILGTYVLSSGYYDAYYLRAQKVRTLIARDFSEAFARCDAIVCPVSPTAAYPLGSCADDPLKMYLGDIFTVTANLAGICGLSVPCGFTSGGLPVGLQILGAPFAEQKILDIGYAYEQSTAWHTEKPAIQG